VVILSTPDSFKKLFSTSESGYLLNIPWDSFRFYEVNS